MDEAPVERRLAAILVADIAGYSRLMADDEAATVAALKKHQGVILPLISAYGGYIQDTAGDGLLAVFHSVLQAVECALAFQHTMAEHNATVPLARQMHWRIGITCGDVMFDGTHVFGESINIAARIQALAAPGGICVTALVREEVGARIPLAFADLGVQQLKNIPRRVRVFRVRLDAQGEPGTTPRRWYRAVLLGLLAVVLAVLLGVGLWLVFWRGLAGDRPHAPGNAEGDGRGALISIVNVAPSLF
jgi:class 3 adenylate cyclase